MPRKYIRKTERAAVPLDVMNRAADAFTAGASLREVAQNFNIDRATLLRFILKLKGKANDEVQTGYSRLTACKRIFPLQMENDLAYQGIIRSISWSKRDKMSGISL